MLRSLAKWEETIYDIAFIKKFLAHSGAYIAKIFKYYKAMLPIISKDTQGIFSISRERIESFIKISSSH